MIYTANVYTYNEMKLDLDPVEDLVINEQELMALNEISIGEVFKKIIDWIFKQVRRFVEWVKNLTSKIKIGKMKAKAFAKKADEVEVGDDVDSEESSFETFKPETFKPETFKPETFKPETFKPDTFELENMNKKDNNRKSTKYKFSKKSALQHGYDLYTKKLGDAIVMDMVTRSTEIFSDEWTEFIERDIAEIFEDLFNETLDYEERLAKKDLNNGDYKYLMIMTAYRIHGDQIMERGYFSEYFDGLRLKNAKELLKALNSRPQYSKKIFYPGVEHAPTPDELKNGTFYEKDIKRVESYANDMIKAYKELADKFPNIQRKYIPDESKLSKEQSEVFYRVVSRLNILLQNSVAFSAAMCSVIDTYVNNIYNKLYPEIIKTYVKFGKQNKVDANERLRFSLAPEGFISGIYRESAEEFNNNARSLFESVCLL